MAPDTRPLFAAYLLPSFSFPFRRRERQQSTTSITSVPYLSYSPTSSANTSPSSSPPSAQFIIPPSAGNGKGKSILHEAFQSLSLSKTRKESVSEEAESEPHLYRAQPNTLKCVTCATDIAFASQIVSKGFTGRHGRAYLVAPPHSSNYLKTTLRSKDKDTEKENAELINIKIGRQVNRELLTGMHVVADVSCVICGMVLGWKYVDAKETSQKYKIGKFILEMKRVVVGVGWEDTTSRDQEEVLGEDLEEEDDVVMFDSEDDDECDDLFAGVWDAETVAKRRGRRVGARKKILPVEV